MRCIVRLHDDTDVAAVSALVEAENDVVFTHVLNGFVADIDDVERIMLEADERVIAVVEDELIDMLPPVNYYTPRHTGGGWARDFITGDGSFTFNGVFDTQYTGAGVMVYMCDTGISLTHPDYGSRAEFWWDAWNNSTDFKPDVFGHGSSVTSAAVGAQFGVAPGARVRGVKIWNDAGTQSSVSSVLSACDRITKFNTMPAVVNWSFIMNYPSFSETQAMLDTGMDALVASGVTVTVSAGNDRVPVTDYWPARHPKVITVGGIQRDGIWILNENGAQNNRGTNYGPEVDLMAPADNITVLDVNGNLTTAAGTSAAAPFVAGAVALYKEAFGNHSWDIIRTWFMQRGGPGVTDPLRPAYYKPPTLLLNGL